MNYVWVSPIANGCQRQPTLANGYTYLHMYNRWQLYQYICQRQTLLGTFANYENKHFTTVLLSDLRAKMLPQKLIFDISGHLFLGKLNMQVIENVKVGGKSTWHSTHYSVNDRIEKKSWKDHIFLYSEFCLKCKQTVLFQ